MSNIGNKETMAKNLSFYLEKSGKTQRELAEIVDVSSSTFNDWVKAKKYPRIDKIEKMANYFGILKSDLIEEKSSMWKEMEQKNDVIASVVVRMRMDNDFLDLIKALLSLDSAQIRNLKTFIDTFTTKQ